MEFDDDPFADTEKPVVKRGARAGGRFQPRAKAQPRKETSSSVPSSIPVETKEKAVTLSTTQSAQPVNIVDNNLTNPAIVETKESLKNNEESLSGVPNKQSEVVNPSSQLSETKEDLTSADAPPPEASVPGSTKEADPAGFDLDPFADVILEPATSNARAGGKFRPKAKPKLREKTSAPKEQSLIGPVGPSLATSEFVGTKKPSEDNHGSFLDDSRSVELAMPSPQLVTEDVGSKDALHVEVAKSNNNGDLPSDIGKSAVEVNSMELNLDSQDDILCEPGTSSAQAGGRFQPKAESRPTMETSAAVGSALPNVTIEKPVTSGPTLSDDYRSSGLTNPSQLVATAGFDSEVAVSSGCRDSHYGLGKSVRENADIFCGLECLDDSLTQSTGGTVDAAIKSDYKVDMDAEPGNKLPTSYAVNNDGECLLSSSETPVPFASSNNDTEENGGIPTQTSVEVSDATEAHTCPDNSMTQDPVDDGSTLIDSGRVQTEDTEAFHDFETLNIIPEGAVASGRRARKFQPKPKVQTGKEKSTTNISHPDAANSQFIPSETECMVHSFPPDDAFDDSSMNFGDLIPPDPTTSELPVNEEVTNLAETSQPEVGVSADDVHSEDVPGMPEKVSSKGRKRKTSLASKSSKKSKKASTAGEVNEGGKSTRQLRKRAAARELVDEPVDEANDNGNSPAGPSSNTAMDEGKDDDDEYRAESSSRKKRAPRKSKKPVAENEKPVRKRKRKRTKEAPDQLTQEPPKKFSHTTRRNKRCVDKVLLQTPEDEIDFQRLPIKDIILFAEYKERIAKKEAKTSTPPPPPPPPLNNQSTETSFREEYSHSEDDRSDSEQYGGSTDYQASYKTQPSSLYFNYQTYMNKPPSSRWSKQDTELFYEAVQQFGTDFSMIQQLFPGRTRHQIKLKYKKEQRQHPLRLSEAETNRTEDHSHFEKVIEQLQQAAAAQAEQDCNEDDSIPGTGEEVDEMTTETNEDAPKSGLDEDVTVKESEADVAEVHSHLKSDESDDDLDIWDSYRSEY